MTKHGENLLIRIVESPKTPMSPSAFRKPSAGNRRKSVTFSDMLGTFPSPKNSHSAQQEVPKVAPTRPARETPEAMLGIQRQFSDFEASLSAATASGIRNVSAESSSTVPRVSDGSMPPPSSMFKVRGEVMNHDVPIITSPWKPKPALFRKPSDASRSPSASSHRHSRQTSGSSRAPSSESKPVSKVKALAQAFNNLTAPKDSVKGRANSNGHKKSDSWTEKIRRSISGPNKRGTKESKDWKMTNEEMESDLPAKDAHKVDEAEANKTDRLEPANAVSKDTHEDEDKQPLIDMSPPGSPSMIPTEPQSLYKSLDALEIRNHGRVSMNLDPFSSAHNRFPTVGPLSGVANGSVQLANSPAGSPSMELTETPFLFPAVVTTKCLDRDSDSPCNEANHRTKGNQHGSFQAPQLNRKSSSIYSQSENDGTPRKQGNSMVGGSLQSRTDGGSSPLKHLGNENDPSPKPSTPMGTLLVHKRNPYTGSPSKNKGHGHKRSNAATPTASRATSAVNHSAFLAGTPSTGASQRTHTPAGIDYSAYLAQDYTEYLDNNFPRDAAPPPIPPRNPARLDRPGHLPLAGHRPVPRETSRAMDESWDSPFPPHPQSQLRTGRQLSAYDSIPAQDPSWATRLASAAHAEVSRQSGVRASRHNNPNSTDQQGAGPQPLTEGIKARAHAEGVRSGALPRLKREARNPGRFQEKVGDGLVGKEQFAAEDRGDDSVWI